MIYKFNEFINESRNNTSDERLFLSNLGFKNFEELQRRATKKWYSRATYGGGERTYIPEIIPMRIIASAVGRYIKVNTDATVRAQLGMEFGVVPFLAFVVKHNGKEVEIRHKDGDIIRFGEDMTTPSIIVMCSGKVQSKIESNDRRNFGDTDWHESEMKNMSDRLLQVLNDVLK